MFRRRRLPPPGSEVIHRVSGVRGRVIEVAEEARWIRPPFSTPPTVPYRELRVAWTGGREGWVDLEEVVVVEEPPPDPAAPSGH